MREDRVNRLAWVLFFGTLVLLGANVWIAQRGEQLSGQLHEQTLNLARLTAEHHRQVQEHQDLVLKSRHILGVDRPERVTLEKMQRTCVQCHAEMFFRDKRDADEIIAGPPKLIPRGDFGAPLTEDDLRAIAEQLEKVLPAKPEPPPVVRPERNDASRFYGYLKGGLDDNDLARQAEPTPDPRGPRGILDRVETVPFGEAQKLRREAGLSPLPYPAPMPRIVTPRMKWLKEFERYMGFAPPKPPVDQPAENVELVFKRAEDAAKYKKFLEDFGPLPPADEADKVEIARDRYMRGLQYGLPYYNPYYSPNYPFALPPVIVR